MSSGQHVINVGTMVEAVACPAKNCGERCALCEGRRRVPKFIAERYCFPNSHRSSMGKI